MAWWTWNEKWSAVSRSCIGPALSPLQWWGFQSENLCVHHFTTGPCRPSATFGWCNWCCDWCWEQWFPGEVDSLLNCWIDLACRSWYSHRALSYHSQSSWSLDALWWQQASMLPWEHWWSSSSTYHHHLDGPSQRGVCMTPIWEVAHCMDWLPRVQFWLFQLPGASRSDVSWWDETVCILVRCWKTFSFSGTGIWWLCLWLVDLTFSHWPYMMQLASAVYTRLPQRSQQIEWTISCDGQAQAPPWRFAVIKRSGCKKKNFRELRLDLRGRCHTFFSICIDVSAEAWRRTGADLAPPPFAWQVSRAAPTYAPTYA